MSSFEFSGEDIGEQQGADNRYVKVNAKDMAGEWFVICFGTHLAQGNVGPYFRRKFCG